MQSYLLDTNTFWEVLEAWDRGEQSDKLPPDLWQNNQYTFAIPGISAAEIYSVLGKKARGKKRQIQKCVRTLSDKTTCANDWIDGAIPPLKKEFVQDFSRLIRGIFLKKAPYFDITIIPITEEIMQKSANLLQLYAINHDFHSLDATVAATAALGNYKVVTFDKNLRTVLTQMDVDLF
jgi:predicted nucleic acid-binding protein